MVAEVADTPEAEDTTPSGSPRRGRPRPDAVVADAEPELPFGICVPGWSDDRHSQACGGDHRPRCTSVQKHQSSVSWPIAGPASSARIARVENIQAFTQDGQVARTQRLHGGFVNSWGQRLAGQPANASSHVLASSARPAFALVQEHVVAGDHVGLQLPHDALARRRDSGERRSPRHPRRVS